MKKIARKAPLYDQLRLWVMRRREDEARVEWEQRESLLVPSPAAKQRTLRSYAERYRLKVLVETGTYYGDTVDAMKGVFERIYSIELSNELHEKAKKRFEGVERIHLICGDSSVELGHIMSILHQPALFWLDGHYSGGETAQGDRDTPIYDELNHILEAPDRGHVIIIDDARCFGRDRDYPSIRKLSAFVWSRRPDVGIAVQDDSIRIEPRP